MPHERFYCDHLLERGERIRLVGAEFHHLAHVFRMRVGEEVELVNGRGDLARGRIEALKKEEALIESMECEHQERATPLLMLGCALIRVNRLEWMVEKGTELGADALFLFAGDHSEKESLSNHQLERVRHLVIAALKQCGRLYLPEIALFPSLEALLDQETKATVLFGATGVGAKPMPDIHADRVLFVTGPEQGLSAAEQQLLESRGVGVRLHTNILRAETAPLAALSLLWGITRGR